MTRNEATAFFNYYFSQGNQELYEARFQQVKAMLSAYHTDEQARMIIDSALELAACSRILPDNLTIFYEFYIDRKMTARQISEKHYVQERTLYRILKNVIMRLMPIIYGVDGIPFQ